MTLWLRFSSVLKSFCHHTFLSLSGWVSKICGEVADKCLKFNSSHIYKCVSVSQAILKGVKLNKFLAQDFYTWTLLRLLLIGCPSQMEHLNSRCLFKMTMLLLL